MNSVMRRGSRKKQDASSSREESSKVSPTTPGAARRQQHTQEILHQQRKKHQDEITNLTTKNYRLAKELADLRLKHRDECKHVTRLTMENMNLASRCRETITHVAMLKKELAMQQKRTAQALASQREQTKRMTDSLTNSFLSLSSPDSVESKNQSSNNKNPRNGVGMDEDENVIRLVSTTPSPTRVGHHQRLNNRNVDSNGDGNQSYSKLVVQTSTATTTSSSTRNTKPTSPMEESRDSPATTATNSSTSEMAEDDTVVDSIKLASSTLSEGPEDEMDHLSEGKNTQKLPIVYSTPKKSERPKSSQFQEESDNEFGKTTAEKAGLFPFSASPQMFNKSNSNSNRDKKSYDEGFPSDTIDQPESNNNGKYAKFKPKMTLSTSIDAFEKSFSTDFSDSFTPKEGNSNGSLQSSGSGEKIYDPFFGTPPKPKSQTEYLTPPNNAKKLPLTNTTNTDKNDKDEVRPKRPEKTIPSATRARYERALGPKVESSTRSQQPIGNEAEKSSSSVSTNTGPLYRRMQKKKRLDENLESISNGSTTKGRSASTLTPNHHAILDMVDSFEENGSGNTYVVKEQQSLSPSRFQGPIKSLRRRSVSKPISYAEPKLNTKLRRGDTFFPKTGPNMTVEDGDNGCDDHNQVPNRVQPPAVVSP